MEKRNPWYNPSETQGVLHPIDPSDIKKDKFEAGHLKNHKSDEDVYFFNYKGYRWRVRTEIIVFDETGKVFVNPNNPKRTMHVNGYNFPGGGIKPDEEITQAAIRECEEEALFTPVNVVYSGIAYLTKTPEYFDIDGLLSFICVGFKGPKYNKYIKKIDRDVMATKGKWVDPKFLPLHKFHKMAIQRASVKSTREAVDPELIKIWRLL